MAPAAKTARMRVRNCILVGRKFLKRESSGSCIEDVDVVVGLKVLLYMLLDAGLTPLCQKCT
jgi:hypothetical protein